jgi:hypothetical protein
MPHHYMIVISPGPALVVRVPVRVKGLKGRYEDIPRWAAILKAMTPVMHFHQLRQKDIHQLEHLYDPGDDNQIDSPNVNRLEAAFKGDEDILPRVWLYDWVDGKFSLSRKPKEISPPHP